MNIIITGCNGGMGKAIADKFAKNGNLIIACVRTLTDEFNCYMQSLKVKYGIDYHIIVMDLKNSDSIKDACKSIKDLKIEIDVLINNAGVMAQRMLLLSSMKELRNVFEINFFGQVQFTQGIVKIMSRQKHGNIINMSSVVGLDAYPGNLAYGSSKAAMAYFTKTVSQELAAFNIRVNAIAPTVIETAMKDQISPGSAEEMLHRSAIKRLGQPTDVANMAYFLASDAAAFITGQIIRVDGGLI